MDTWDMNEQERRATNEDAKRIIDGATMPPLGLRPRIFAMEERFREVDAAIERYVDAGSWPIPQEWVEEYHELREWILNYRK